MAKVTPLRELIGLGLSRSLQLQLGLIDGDVCCWCSRIGLSRQKVIGSRVSGSHRDRHRAGDPSEFASRTTLARFTQAGGNTNVE